MTVAACSDHGDYVSKETGRVLAAVGYAIEDASPATAFGHFARHHDAHLRATTAKLKELEGQGLKAEAVAIGNKGLGFLNRIGAKVPHIADTKPHRVQTGRSGSAGSTWPSAGCAARSRFRRCCSRRPTSTDSTRSGRS